jgi:hypothetical protein
MGNMINWSHIALSIGLLSIAGMPVTHADDDSAPAPNTATTRPAHRRVRVALNLPDLGSPRTPSKIGGCRTSGENLLVAALSPGEPGLTTHSSPTLYWYLSNPTPHQIEFTLTPLGNIDPILDLTFDGSKLQGLQSVDLALHGIHLETPPDDSIDPSRATGQVLAQRRPLCEWVVAVIRDPDRRSHDVIGVGFVERALPDKTLEAELHQAGGDHADRAAVFARHNRWYDAVTEINRAIDADPTDVDLRQSRAGLLAQVGLSLNLDGPRAGASNAPVAIQSATTQP